MTIINIALGFSFIHPELLSTNCCSSTCLNTIAGFFFNLLLISVVRICLIVYE